MIACSYNQISQEEFFDRVVACPEY